MKPVTTRPRRPKTDGLAVCLRDGGYKASLEVRKHYPVLHDPDAEANDLVRVVDESGGGITCTLLDYSKG